MENNNLKEVKSLPPFKKMCISIGALPSSYLLSLTHEEQLLWLCKYLQDVVIPTVDNNAECVEELQNLFLKLQQWCKDYLSDLNVQDEINNKLDAMAEDGTLSEIINQEIFGNINNQIAEMQENIENNSSKIQNLTMQTNENTGNIENLMGDIQEQGMLLNKRLPIYKVNNVNDLCQHMESDEACIILVEYTTNGYNFDQFNRDIQIKSNKMIIGLTNNNNGKPFVILNYHNFILYDTITPAIQYNGYKNITIKDIRFNYGCISMAHCNNITLDDCAFYNMNYNHFIQIAASKNVNILNTTFRGSIEYLNTEQKYDATKEFINIDPMTPTSFPTVFAEDSAFYDDTMNQNIKISKCYFDNNPSQSTYNHNYACIGCHSYSKNLNNKHERITIEKCEFNNVSVHAIRLTQMLNVTIKENSCTKCARFLTIYRSNQVYVYNNNIYQVANFIYASSESTNTNYNFEIYNNFIITSNLSNLNAELFPLNYNNTLIDLFYSNRICIKNNNFQEPVNLMTMRFNNCYYIDINGNNIRRITLPENQSTCIDLRDNIQPFFVNNNHVHGIARTNTTEASLYLVRMNNSQSGSTLFANSIGQDTNFNNSNYSLYITDKLPKYGDCSRTYNLNDAAVEQTITIDEQVENIGKIVLVLGQAKSSLQTYEFYPYFTNFRTTNTIRYGVRKNANNELTTLIIEFTTSNTIKIKFDNESTIEDVYAPRKLKIYPINQVN